ncbi:MAG: hypothetical protein A3F42_00060 [Gammaproteobacteria bacterium RIFCSPHIGHO2_12_FULL_37_34]|nr:MAG: hypothetical protein A3F42_00060 [Gammaproteobacteria bacterium RIFCSPHIGHO2_12_FULL_37_34]
MKQDKNSNRSYNISSLRWACRRGMLELDVLLQHFLEKAYVGLSQADQTLFIQLLECSDQELFSWLIGQNRPSDQHLLRIIDLVRHHARSRI